MAYCLLLIPLSMVCSASVARANTGLYRSDYNLVNKYQKKDLSLLYS